MSVIVNKDTLIKRAIDHKISDHITAGTYGEIDFSENGEDKVNSWNGCAISCLATGGSIKEIKEQIKNGEIPSSEFHTEVKVTDDTFTTFWSISSESDTLRSLLSEKFGLSYKLILLAEIVFEGVNENEEDDWEEYCNNWPLDFATALPEGVDITDSDVDIFWEDNVSEEIELDPDNYRDADGHYWTLDDYFELGNQRVGNALIDWLKTFK
jgi:hypothetical protein